MDIQCTEASGQEENSVMLCHRCHESRGNVLCIGIRLGLSGKSLFIGPHLLLIIQSSPFIPPLLPVSGTAKLETICLRAGIAALERLV